MSSTIENPIRRGQRVVIPAGTPFRSMNPRLNGVQITKKTHTVTVHSTDDGHIQRWDERNSPRGTTILPMIDWPGAGGYWTRVQVTPEFLTANDLTPLTMPELDKAERYDIGLGDGDEGLPSLEDGYTNRWATPAN